MSKMDLGDWMVFLTILCSFATLFVISVLFVFRNHTLKLQVENREAHIKQLDGLLKGLEAYIQKRDHEGWNYVHGSGSGEPQSVLEKDNRGRHHRDEPTPDIPEFTSTVVLDGDATVTVIRGD